MQNNIDQLKNALNEHSINQLYEQAAKGVSEKEQYELKVIKKVFLGALYARQCDDLNDKSTALYKEAVAMAENCKNNALQIWTNTQTGFYFYSYNEYAQALPCFLKSSRALDKEVDSELLEGAEVLKLNAYFFGTITEHDKSISYLNRALKLVSPQSKNYADMLNALGNCYLNKDDLNKAETYFEQTKQNALQNQDEMRYAKALGDLARVYKRKKNWQQAERLLLEDIRLSELHNSNRNVIFARLQLGKLYLEKGDIDKAYQTLTAAKQYASNKTYLKGFQMEIVKLLLEVAVKQNNVKEELSLRRELSLLQSVTQTYNQETINRIALETQKEKIQWQLEAEAEKTERIQLLKQMWITVSILLFAIAILIFFLYKHRLKQRTTEFEHKLLSFQYEKAQSEHRLTAANNSLASFHTFLEEKNKQIKLLETEIQNINSKEEKVTLEKLLSSNLMTNENWKLFKQAFIEEQQEYYNSLMTDFPGLTESNLRIVLLQKIGLNNSETANLLGITSEAVKKAKQRMRKKYSQRFDDALEFV